MLRARRLLIADVLTNRTQIIFTKSIFDDMAFLFK